MIATEQERSGRGLVLAAKGMKPRRIEDELYRSSESHFFKLPEELRDPLDVPSFMRTGGGGKGNE